MINENTRLISICTTFRRPELLKQMIGSFNSTKSDGTEIYIYLHNDDPRLEEYKPIVKGYSHEIGKHRCLQEVINRVVFDVHPSVPYYQIICDDHIYETKFWDEGLIKILSANKDWGFCCGNDMLNTDWWTWAHPSAEIWSWKMAKTLGFVYPKCMRHFALDLYTKDVSIAINKQLFVPSVIIRHLHGVGAAGDINTTENYAQEVINAGHSAYGHWKENERDADIKRLLDAMMAEG